jgi:hypothetical protein
MMRRQPGAPRANSSAYVVWWTRRAFARARRNRGNRCRSCASGGDLQFAHRKPTGLDGRGRGSLHRILDIRRYPRRYVLLCRRCHLAFDTGTIRPAAHGLGWRCDLDHELEHLGRSPENAPTIPEDVGRPEEEDAVGESELDVPWPPLPLEAFAASFSRRAPPEPA